MCELLVFRDGICCSILAGFTFFSLLASAKCKMASGQFARCFLLDEKSLPPTNAVPNGWMKVDFPFFSRMVNSRSWPFTGNDPKWSLTLWCEENFVKKNLWPIVRDMFWGGDILE